MAGSPSPNVPTPAPSLTPEPSSTPLQRRRRRLLLWSVPVILPALLVAGKLLSLPLFAGQASDAFAAGHGKDTVRAAQGMGALNVVESWKAPFAKGDGQALAGDFAAARLEFAAALSQVSGPDACKVRVNLVLSVEQLGDAAEKAGDPASAAALFKDGKEVIAQAPQGCFVPQGEGNKNGEGEALKQAGERLAEKSQQPGESTDPGKENGGEQPGDAPAPPASKSDALQERNSGAAKQRADDEQRRNENSEYPSKSYDKPW
jgi:hypothetical protein